MHAQYRSSKSVPKCNVRVSGPEKAGDKQFKHLRHNKEEMRPGTFVNKFQSFRHITRMHVIQCKDLSFLGSEKGKLATKGANVEGSALKSLRSVFVGDQPSKSLPELHCHVNSHKYSLQQEELPSACFSSSFPNNNLLFQRYFLSNFPCKQP